MLVGAAEVAVAIGSPLDVAVCVGVRLGPEVGVLVGAPEVGVAVGLPREVEVVVGVKPAPEVAVAVGLPLGVEVGVAPPGEVGGGVRANKTVPSLCLPWLNAACTWKLTINIAPNSASEMTRSFPGFGMSCP